MFKQWNEVATKKKQQQKEILPIPTTWMDLEGTTLRETRQAETHSHGESQNTELTETE